MCVVASGGAWWCVSCVASTAGCAPCAAAQTSTPSLEEKDHGMRQSTVDAPCPHLCQRSEGMEEAA